MAKVRVHEVAKDFGLTSKEVLAELFTMGEFVRAASSTVEPAVLARLRERLAARPSHRGASATRPVAPQTVAEEATQVSAVTEVPSGKAREAHPPPVDRSDVRPPGGGRSAIVAGTGTRADTPAPSDTTRRPVTERVVPLHSLGSWTDVKAVMRACKRELVAEERKRLVFDLQDASGFYPSAAVPAVAMIQYFREAGLGVEMRNLPAVADKMSLRNPLEASGLNLADISEPLSRLWVYFDHQQANALTTAFMDCIRRRVECEEGVLEALEWCLYEVMDNVMQHSNYQNGYAMLQLHPRSKRLAVCVADTGIGVQRSLAQSQIYKPKTAFDALTLAVREGVTRNEKTNQGNGLFGLVQIVEQNGGKLNLTSGRGFMSLLGDRVSGNNNQEIIGADNHGTTVDFQLNVDTPVSLGNALNYEPTNLFMESLESEHGEHVIEIRSQAGGAGSRLAARELKTLIVNVLNAGAPHVALDFEGQAVVSSSFADEVIGKMFAEMGFNTFNARVKLRNMNQTVSTLVDRAISRRLQQGND